MSTKRMMKGCGNTTCHDRKYCPHYYNHLERGDVCRKVGAAGGCCYICTPLPTSSEDYIPLDIQKEIDIVIPA